MSTDVEPVVGNRYHDVESTRSFEVRRFDRERGRIGLTFEDGTAAELSLEQWREMTLWTAAPEQWAIRPDESRSPPRRDELTDEQYRHALDWGERSPDDFDETEGLREPR